MPELAFVTSPLLPWHIRELAETIAFELEQQGIPTSIHSDGFPAARPDRVYALMAPLDYLRLEGEDAIPDQAILARTIGISAEPPLRDYSEDQLAFLRRIEAIYDIDVRTVQRLFPEGIHGRTLRPGYSRLRDRFDAEADRPVDVVFLGAATPRRMALLAQYAPMLARHNCHLQLTDPLIPSPAGSPSYLAEEKHELLAAAKVVIHLHGDDSTHAPWLRMIETMHCGAVFVTEHASGLLPFVAGEHLLVADQSVVPEIVEAVLRDSARADRIRRAAYERLSTWLPFAMSVAVLRASIVELVGAPVSRDAARGSGARRAARPWGAWWPEPSAAGPEVRALQRAVGDSGAEISELRRQITELRRAVGSADERAGALTAHASAAWSARTADVSVLLTLGTTADGVTETLASVAGGELAAEVVLVGSGIALRAARGWIAEHPHVPVLTIEHAGSSELGEARNLAVARARGSACLILEQGTVLYPRCTRVLAGTLAADAGIDFAYAMVHLSAGGGREPVLNCYGWEPGRLRLRHYVDTPYLVRTAALCALGGFTEDVRLHGWEDYDLWCRMAEDDRRGQLVAQLLAHGGPSHATSRRDLGAPESRMGLIALAERAPRLLADLTAG